MKQAQVKKSTYKKPLSFSAKTPVGRKKQEILSSSGLSEATRIDSYLGLPSLVGKSRIQAFNGIKEKVWKKLNNWKVKFLSLAGREILLKAVIQAIPTYSMCVF
jgi:hypothetical protein